MLLFFSLIFLHTLCFAGSRIVFISDSHGVGKFGDIVKTHLRAREDTRFHFFASGGSAPLQWINNAFTTTCGYQETSSDANATPGCQRIHTPRFSSIWERYPRVPNERRISIIALGTNLSPKASERAPQITQIRRLMDVALAQSDLCIWVGPPNMRRSPDFDQQGVENKVSMIQEVQNRCTFIDSRMISQDPSQGDGIHYHWPGSRNIEQIQASSDWANAVMQEVESIISQN